MMPAPGLIGQAYGMGQPWAAEGPADSQDDQQAAQAGDGLDIGSWLAENRQAYGVAEPAAASGHFSTGATPVGSQAPYVGQGLIARLAGRPGAAIGTVPNATDLAGLPSPDFSYAPRPSPQGMEAKAMAGHNPQGIGITAVSPGRAGVPVSWQTDPALQLQAFRTPVRDADDVGGYSPRPTVLGGVAVLPPLPLLTPVGPLPPVLLPPTVVPAPARGSGPPPGYDRSENIPSGTPGFAPADPGLNRGTPPRPQDLSIWGLVGKPVDSLVRGIGSLVFSGSSPKEAGAGNRPELYEAYGHLGGVPDEYRSNSRFMGLASDPDKGGRYNPVGWREAITTLEAEKQGLIAPGSVRALNTRSVDIFDGRGTPIDIKTPPTLTKGELSGTQAAGAIEGALGRSRLNPVTGKMEDVKVLLDTTYLSDADYAALKQELQSRNIPNIKNLIEVRIRSPK